MGGGLMQLVAHGAQDVYLTGDPQITYFKVVYRRHTNFSMESIQQQFQNDAAPGTKTSCLVSRNGDLVGPMYLQFKLNPTWMDSTTAPADRNLGFVSYLKSVEIEIGGQKIDKHFGRWLDIWDDLTTDANKDEGLSAMLGNKDSAKWATAADPAYTFVPLQFWFNRNIGLALPLIALQYHEVKINFDFDTTGGTEIWTEVGLWIDYIFLDTDERKRFAQLSHEYLIDQIQQHSGSEGEDFGSGDATRFELNFNHPVKELVWVCENSAAITGSGNTNTTLDVNDGAGNVTPSNIANGNLDAADTRQICLNNVKLQINGHDRFYPRHGDYFRLQQPYQFHSTVPPAKDIYCYSFALRPEEHQPSGTANFSRIDSCHLTLTRGTRLTTGDIATPAEIVTPAAGQLCDKLFLYAINYNVLRIASGMAGLAYSN